MNIGIHQIVLLITAPLFLNFPITIPRNISSGRLMFDLTRLNIFINGYLSEAKQVYLTIPWSKAI